MSEVMRVLGSLLVISVCGSPLYIRLASTSLRIPHSLTPSHSSGRPGAGHSVTTPDEVKG